MSGWKTTVLVVALAVSLLGNALAVGAGLQIWKVRQSILGDGPAITLPRTERRALIRALVSHQDEMRPALTEVQTARRAAVEAVLARPYDAAQASAALDALRGALGELMREGQMVLLADLNQRTSVK
jgi:uncharacterized membrane protein